VVGVGKTGGVLALGFGEGGEGMFETLLESGAGHGVRLTNMRVRVGSCRNHLGQFVPFVIV
jgi:hypothetical protein